MITFAAVHFNTTPAFVEKDYWITLLLYRLAKSKSVGNAVFKGGTSLSKGYRIVNRFSEYIDIAMINNNLSGNSLKTKIRNIEKEITTGLTEIIEQVITSKGSMFRKTIFEYPTVLSSRLDSKAPNRIIVEINAFANPYPYVKLEITSFITEFLAATNRIETIEKYNLQMFSLNILDKRRTMIEKLVSLVLFSFSENPTQALAAKIRHFYDLYHLAEDTECAEYIKSTHFKTDFEELFILDKQAFDTPDGWRTKDLAESPLVTKFSSFWKTLRTTYQNELTQLAFIPIPEVKLIERNFVKLMNKLIAEELPILSEKK